MSLTTPKFFPVKGENPVILTHTKENLAQFRYSQFYINEREEDIFVTLRNNLSVRIPKASSGYKRGSGFKIRNVYVFQNIHVINDTINNIAKLKKNFPNGCKDLDLIKSVLLQRIANEHSAYCEVVIDHCFDTMSLAEVEILYNPETDVMINYKSLDLSCPHPFSDEGSSMVN